MVLRSCVLFLLFIMVLCSFSDVVAAERIGTADFGYVDKDIYGNPDSGDVIVVVTGMHPLESGSHNAMINKLKSMSSHSNKRYIHYNIRVTKNPYDYNIGRMNGQLLAQKFIILDVSRHDPVLVVDIHENRWKTSGYKYSRFLYPIRSTNLTKYYTNHIISETPFLVTYIPPNPTSPPYMAIPLAEKGIPILIYENYMYDTITTKNTHMNQFINILDAIKPFKGNITIVKTYNLSNAQYKELCRRISKFKAEKGGSPLYVDIKDMNVGLDQVTQVQHQDMENRWDQWIKEHNGREPQIIGIEKKYQP